jgi:glycosyltransferase involved in cell wall biosynthesis
MGLDREQPRRMPCVRCHGNDGYHRATAPQGAIMRALMVADRPEWAYDLIAQGVQSCATRWEVDIAFVIDFRRNLAEFDIRYYDIVFFFLWTDAFRYGPSIPYFDPLRCAVGVHSHASLEKRGINLRTANEILDGFAAVGVVSEILLDLLPGPNRHLTPSGCDPSVFRPRPFPDDAPLRVLWVGNPDSAHHGNNKGFHSIIRPVVDSMEGVELITATAENPIPHHEMGGFYAQGDVLVCMSATEGGPLPVLEAMHCARPVISTPVGVVPEILDAESGWMVERSRPALRAALLSALERRAELPAMGRAAAAAVSGRTLATMAAAYENLFDHTYARWKEARRQ